MELRGDKLAYGEYYRIIGNNPERQSITYLIGVSEWEPNTSYKANQLIRVLDYRPQYSTNYRIYRCKLNHVSGNTFGIDIETKWEQMSLSLQEVRDDIDVVSPLQYNNSTSTFSITESDATTDGYLSSTDWVIFNNKQQNYTLRFIGQVINSQTVLLSNTNFIGKFECSIYNSSTLQIVSYFNIIRYSDSTFDMYLKNDENLITDTQNTSNRFNMYIDGTSKNFYLQNNLDYSIYFNIYRTAFKTSFDPSNPFAP